MPFFADAALHDALVAAGFLVGIVLLFIIVHKIVKLVLSLVIVAVIAALAVYLGVRAGYISPETADRLNPFHDEALVEKAEQAGAWLGDKAQETAKRAMREVIKEAAQGEENSRP